MQLTNSSGTVTKNYKYDAFGVEIGKADNDTNPWRYCGEYWDEETETYYLRARYYHPRTGRFLSEDPIRDGLNWYTYCAGNPVFWIDPSGLIIMGLREMVIETYGTDEGLTWDNKTKTASINGVNFVVGKNGCYVKDGRMYLDSAVFAKAMGLDGKFGSHNSNLSREGTLKALRSEYANSVVWDGGFKLNPDKYYFLDMNGHTVDIRMTNVSIHVSMVSGDARSLCLGNPNKAGWMAGWLKDLYEIQYGKEFAVGTSAMALELFAHAAPDKFIEMLPSSLRSKFDFIKIHSKEADIAGWGDERWYERVLWDSASILIHPNTTGYYIDKALKGAGYIR